MKTAVTHAVPITDVRITLREMERPYTEVLAATLSYDGLKRPILLTHEGILIDGLRRLRAAKRLGWTEIDAVRVTTLAAAVKVLGQAQTAKDAERLNWTSMGEIDAMLAGLTVTDESSKTSRGDIAKALGTNESKLAQVRQLWRASKGRPIGRNPALPAPKLIEKAREVLEILDGGQEPAKHVWMRWKKEVAAYREESVELVVDIAQDELLAGGIPDPTLRTQHAGLRRQAWIKKLAADDMSSVQIGAAIGMRPPLVRDWARRLGVDIRADRALGRGHLDRSVNVDRVMATMVADLDAMTWALTTVDENIPDLDPARMQGWIRDLGSFTYRLRVLTDRLRDHAKDHLKDGEESGN